jgi:hypothetical protein
MGTATANVAVGVAEEAVVRAAVKAAVKAVGRGRWCSFGGLGRPGKTSKR